MKRYILRLFQVIILLLSISTLINTNVKAENKVSYITMLKENNIIEDVNEEVEEIPDTKIVEEQKIETSENAEKQVKKTSKNEVSSKKEVKTATKSVTYGTFGRIYISNYSAALYDYNVNTSSEHSLQTIVDAKDSAAYYKIHGKLDKEDLINYCRP